LLPRKSTISSTHGFSFVCYRVRIRIEANDPAALARARKQLPYGSKLVSSSRVDRSYALTAASKANNRGLHALYVDGSRLISSRNADRVFHRLESEVRLTIAELAPHRIFVHAGVVAWKGKAIVIPGRSFAGKSTLVAELVKAGATYYSDEYAVLDLRGRVHPFHKPLHIRSRRSERLIDVTELGGRAGTTPLQTGLVLVARFKRGAKWRPRELSSGAGVLELLANTVAARREPEKALTVLQRVVAHAQVLKGVRGEAREIVHSLLALRPKS
jgi:hypothetical protein